MKHPFVTLFVSAVLCVSSFALSAQSTPSFSGLAKQKNAVCLQMSSAKLSSIQSSVTNEQVGKVKNVSYVQLPACKKATKFESKLLKKLNKEGYVEIRSSENRVLLFSPAKDGTLANCVMIYSSEGNVHFQSFDCEENVLNALIGQKMYGSAMAYFPAF